MRRLALISGIVLPTLVYAAPPEGASDPVISAWYRGLKVPGTEMICCSLADCRNTMIRERDGHVEAFISREVWRDGPDDWEIVPEEVVLHGIENPTGSPVVCYYNREIRCFVPGVKV